VELYHTFTGAGLWLLHLIVVLNEITSHYTPSAGIWMTARFVSCLDASLVAASSENGGDQLI
jgi:hypothetical protein